MKVTIRLKSGADPVIFEDAIDVRVGTAIEVAWEEEGIRKERGWPTVDVETYIKEYK